MPLPFDGRRCKIHLNGVVHFSWGQPNGTVDMEERGVRVVSNPTVPFTLQLGGPGLISRDVQLQPNGAVNVGLGKKGLFNPTQKNKFFGLLSKLNICL